MKKLLLSAVTLLTFTFTLQAQDYGPVEWDIVRFGYVIPSGDGVSGGISLGSEGRYNINNKISVGLRAEFALFGSADDDGGSVGASGSYALMGDYYFQSESNRRAFAGLGLGTFGGATITSIDAGGNEIETSGDGSIGVIPRIGYELGFLRISGEYNLLLGDSGTNYFGIQLGLTIGGRKK